MTERLLTAAGMVRRGKITADIGTDHAALPIWLIQNGISPYAYASDINLGPVKRAEENVIESGYADQIKVIRADGLNGIEKLDPLPEDIIIAGMGGELIRDILSADEYNRAGGVHLILQPMTKADSLRSWLTGNGYVIDDENIVLEQRRVYRLMSVRYLPSASEPPYSYTELKLGRRNIQKRGEHFAELVMNELKLAGIRVNGRPHPDDLKLISDCEGFLNENK